MSCYVMVMKLAGMSWPWSLLGNSQPGLQQNCCTAEKAGHEKHTGLYTASGQQLNLGACACRLCACHSVACVHAVHTCKVHACRVHACCACKAVQRQHACRDSRFSVGSSGLGLLHLTEQVLPQLQSFQCLQLLQLQHTVTVQHTDTL